ncbi:MAG: YraN family protein [Thiolinea sp.]
MAPTTKAVGTAAEDRALAYLEAQGLHLLMRNYRLKGGEIDLILRDSTHVVFAEVRYRRSNQFGGAIHSIDARKQRKLIMTATHYIQRYNVTLPVRFDVIALSGKDDIQWVQNAFTADG